MKCKLFGIKNRDTKAVEQEINAFITAPRINVLHIHQSTGGTGAAGSFGSGDAFTIISVWYNEGGTDTYA